MDDEPLIKTAVEQQPSADEWQLLLAFRRCSMRRRTLLIAIAHSLAITPPAETKVPVQGDGEVIPLRRAASRNDSG